MPYATGLRKIPQGLNLYATAFLSQGRVSLALHMLPEIGRVRGTTPDPCPPMLRRFSKIQGYMAQCDATIPPKSDML